MPNLKDNIDSVIKLIYRMTNQAGSDYRKYEHKTSTIFGGHCEHFGTDTTIAALGTQKEIVSNGVATLHQLLQHNNGYRDLNGRAPGIFSNDLDFAKTITALGKEQPSGGPNTAKLGILLGESYFLSLLPEMSKHVDIVLFADFDNLILAHNLFLLLCLRIAKTRYEFKRYYLNYLANPVILAKLSAKQILTRRTDTKEIYRYKNKNSDFIDADILLRFLETHELFIGEAHILASEERFRKAKKAANKLTFIACPINFFDASSVKTFKNNLNGLNKQNAKSVEISLLNLTNLHQYDAKEPLTFIHVANEPWKSFGNLNKNLRILLADTNNPIILYSIGEQKNQFRTQISRITRDLKSYFIGTKNDAVHANYFWEGLSKLNLSYSQLTEIFSYGTITEDEGDIDSIISTGDTNTDSKLEPTLKKYQISKDIKKNVLPSPETALRRAACVGSTDDVRFFIKFVINVNVQDDNPNSKRSALHWAFINGHSGVIKILKASGAEEIEDATGKKPSDYAKPSPSKTMKSKNSFSHS